MQSSFPVCLLRFPRGSQQLRPNQFVPAFHRLAPQTQEYGQGVPSLSCPPKRLAHSRAWCSCWFLSHQQSLARITCPRLTAAWSMLLAPVMTTYAQVRSPQQRRIHFAFLALRLAASRAQAQSNGPSSLVITTG